MSTDFDARPVAAWDVSDAVDRLVDGINDEYCARIRIATALLTSDRFLRSIEIVDDVASGARIACRNALRIADILLEEAEK